MYDNHFYLEKIYDKKRETDTKKYKIDENYFGRPIDSIQFKKYCGTIFKECKNNGCRHFVKIKDFTTNKKCYKSSRAFF